MLFNAFFISFTMFLSSRISMWFSFRVPVSLVKYSFCSLILSSLNYNVFLLVYKKNWFTSKMKEKSLVNTFITGKQDYDVQLSLWQFHFWYIPLNSFYRLLKRYTLQCYCTLICGDGELKTKWCPSLGEWIDKNVFGYMQKLKEKN